MTDSLAAGQRLRQLREKLGLVMKDVETASMKLATKYANLEFAVYATRLSDIETKGTQPTIYRLYSLAAIYRIDVTEILSWYGIPLANAAIDSETLERPKTHRVTVLLPHEISVPFSFDLGADTSRTLNLGRMIQDWGTLPLALIEQLKDRTYTYAIIGVEDYTMYPLLTPGSIVQVDESQCQIEAGPWQYEADRPLYLIETREELVCCWCALQDSVHLVLIPHPLSSVPQRIVRFPKEAEVVGRVVAVAKRLQVPKVRVKGLELSADNDVHSRRPN